MSVKTTSSLDLAADRLRTRHVVPRPPGLITPDYWRESLAWSCLAEVVFICEYHTHIGCRFPPGTAPIGWVFLANEACRYCMEGEPS